MDKNNPIYIAGHRGMVGSSIVRKLKKEGYTNIVRATHNSLDLCNQEATHTFILSKKPAAVVIAAATVGGILANDTLRGEFIYNNLQIQSNIIHASKEAGVKKLIFLGSSCIYPKHATQPLREEYLLTSPLEPTNEPYAIAKIAGIKMCESYYRQYDCNFYSLMPCNLYGSHDNFDLESSHVLPALMRKFHEGKESNAENVEIWGSGSPYREFLFVDDLAAAIEKCVQNVNAVDIYSKGISQLNIGAGEDLRIRDLAYLIKEVTEFQGDIIFDTSKPDGTPRKLMDSSLAANFDISSSISLKEGLIQTYTWYKKSLTK